MAEPRVKAAAVEPVKLEGDKSNWEYVSVPSEDVLAHQAPQFSNNKDIYYPGQTYLLPPDKAADLKDRIREWTRSRVRILQPGVDQRMYRDLGPRSGERDTNNQ